MALVVLSFGLLITPLNLTGSANQLPQFYSDSNEYSLYGNVKVRGTPSGHLTIAVDSSFPMQQIKADGVYDALFHFAPKKSKARYQDVALDLEGAVVSFTGKRITVLSAERHILLNLTIKKEPANNNIFNYYNDTSRDLPETVRINRGLALGRYDTSGTDTERFWLCGAEGGTCAILKAGGDFRASDSDPLPEQNPCPAGGRGATQCTINCGSNQGCGVTCGAGTYACCHCTNNCHCLPN